MSMANLSARVVLLALLGAATAEAGLVGWFSSTPRDWAFIQQSGGIRIDAPIERDGKVVMPVHYWPEGNSGLAVRRITLARKGSQLAIRVVTQVVEKGSDTGQVHFVDLSSVPAGTYEVYYGTAGDPAERLGTVVVPTPGAEPSSAPSSADAPEYRVLDLGKQVETVAINNSGEVVGNLILPDQGCHAFLFSHGRVRDLGTLGGPASLAVGINDSGVVVGNSDTAEKSPRPPHRHLRVPFIYENGTMRPLAGPGTSLISAVCAINDRNQLAIEATLQMGAILSNGVVTPLGTLVPEGTGRQMGWKVASDGSRTPMVSYEAGYVVPCRINEDGEVIGVAATPDGKEHAFLYCGHSLRDLGAMGGDYSAAKDINSAGVVVGAFNSKEGRRHAFRYAHGKMTDLGVPAGCEDSTADGINDLGEIVGTGYSARPGGFLRLDVSSRPFLYRQGHWIDLMTRVDLAGSGLKTLYDAERINLRGQIIGRAMGADDVWHGYLLTPIGRVGRER